MDTRKIMYADVTINVRFVRKKRTTFYKDNNFHTSVGL